MLQALHISNYALIDNLEIEFSTGLNIITGETGAGKSIMLGAISLLLGERAEQRMIRDRDRKSVIEATFTDIAIDSDIHRFITENDLDWDESALILRREIAPGGRSRAFINDSPVNLSILRQLSLRLVDLHSQHQNLLLATPEYQLLIIDSMAGISEEVTHYRALYQAYRSAVARYRRAKRDIASAQEEEEFSRHQLSRLVDMNLYPGIQEELEQERERLANVEEIKSTLNDIASLITEGDDDTIGRLKRAADDAASLSSAIDEAPALADRLESIRVELRDIADTFADYDSQLTDDPSRLEWVESRLNDIYDLQRKHHVDSVGQLLDIQTSLEEKLSAIEGGEEALARLETAARQAKAKAVAAAESLSTKRQQAAKAFGEMLLQRARPLGMANLAVDIRVIRGELTPMGLDRVDFMFAFNKNQELMPVGSTASGGEISRLMLSIKSIIASRIHLPTIIFDEIDTGVSGDVARRMGEMMVDISRDIQVIAITHLPQVAARGQSHYKVYKVDDDSSTTTRVRPLAGEERVTELAIMLSGCSDDPTAIAAARSLLHSD